MIVRRWDREKWIRHGRKPLKSIFPIFFRDVLKKTCFGPNYASGINEVQK